MPNTFKRVTLAELHANPNNIRTDIGDVNDLAESIVNTGLLEPLVVCKNDDGYQVIAGHRRLAAIALATANALLPEDYPVEVIVRPKVSEQEQLAMMLVENMQRVDLPVKDQVHGIFALVGEHGWTQAQVAEALGQSVNMIKQRAKWGELPDSVLDRVQSGQLNMQDLDNLCKLDTAARQKLLSKKSVSNWDIEQAVREKKANGETASLVRNLTKLGHLAVNVAQQNERGGGMPDVVAAFIENLGDDKVTQKIDVWDPKTFLATADGNLPAVLLVVKHGYNWKVDVITSTDNAGEWKPKDWRNREADDVEGLTDYEVEEARLYQARQEAEKVRSAEMRAIQVAYVLDTKPGELVAAVLGADLRRGFLHGMVGAVDRIMLTAVLGEELSADVAAVEKRVLEFASKNATNLARCAAALSVGAYQGIKVPGLDDMPEIDCSRFRIDALRYDEDGAALSDEAYLVAVAEHEAELAEEQAAIAAAAAEAELEDGEEISDAELAAIADELAHADDGLDA